METGPAQPARWEGGLHLAGTSPSAVPPRGLRKGVGFFILELTIPAVRSADALSSGELPSGGPLASDVACSFGGRRPPPCHRPASADQTRNTRPPPSSAIPLG